MPSWEFVKLYIVSGLALGGVYALSGVGMVVLYRATGVLNLAFGAVGALGAYLSFSVINQSSCSLQTSCTAFPTWLAYLIPIGFAAGLTLLYGLVFGPALAGRDPLVKAIGTLGLALILVGIMDWKWGQRAGTSVTLPTTTWACWKHPGSETSCSLPGGLGVVNWTQIIALAIGVFVTAGAAAFLRFTKLGTAMRAMANDREITATLGVPVRRVEMAAWLGSGIVCGVAGILLSNLLGLDIPTLTFFFISAVAAALVARLRSLWVTLFAALVIGLVQAMLTPFSEGLAFLADYRAMTPFVLAIVTLLWLGRRRMVTVSRAAQ